MPELPEVESVRRQLSPALRGRTIVGAWWDDHPAQRFSDVGLVRGRRVLDVRRRGKYLLLPLDDDLELVLHLGMTGAFRFDEPHRHDRARLSLDDGRVLHLRDPRRFGRVSVVEAGVYDEIPTLAHLGPEPLGDDFDAGRFAAALAATSAPVKAALLSQRPVAGVGNIYADEALWRARIHPASRRVGPARSARLREEIRDVLAESVAREGTTFRDYSMVNGQSGRNAAFLDVYGRAGLPCACCGATLRATTIAGRTTTYCAGCQRV